MKKRRLSIVLISLALMLSVSVGALAAAPAGYDTVDTTSYNGAVVSYDNSTLGSWLSSDGLYVGGDMDAKRIYGSEAYMIPMTKDCYAKNGKFDNFNKPIGIVYDKYSTWPASHTYNFGEEGDLATMTCYSYSTTSSVTITNAGLEKSGNIQIPELTAGSLEQYATSGAYVSSDFGVVADFKMADDEWHLFSVYFNGPLETYRVGIINGSLGNTYVQNGVYRQDAILADLKSSRLDLDAYIDIGDYMAETGIYVTFKIKGDFTLVAGCNPDYSRQEIYGMNAKVRGFFFDEFIDDSDSEIITAMHTKLDSRQVYLQWEASNFDYSTTILRKEAGASDATWVPIAVIPKGIVSHVDKTADAGVSYNYAYASSKGGRFTQPRVITTVYDTATDYNDVYLSFSPSEIVTSRDLTATVGQTLTINTYLKEQDGDPLVGEKVYLQLAGKFIGGMVTDVVYTATTDKQGIAKFRIPCDYANQVDGVGYHHYDVSIFTEYNDVLKYKPSQLAGTLTVKNKNVNLSTLTPYILELSDSVKAGEVLNITGSNLYESQGISIYATPVSENPSFDIDNAIEISEIIQYDNRGNFINVRLPENLPGGIYDIWAVNASGYVSPSHLETRLNAPRLFWISEDSAFPGITIKAVGTNFLSSYFGAEGETLVRLSNDKGANYMMPIVSVNNYCVEFMVTDIPLGEYDVSISTDGYTWSNFLDDQILTIIPEGVGDPLGLGVAWANKFNYTDIFNVVDYGATPDDTTDDTHAFWIAIRQAQLNGGGVVYVPRGTFYVTNVVMQNGVILMGESRKNTILKYCGELGGLMVSTDPECTGLFGIYNLSVTVADPEVQPDQYFQLGDQWGSGTKNQNLRVADYIFIKDVDCTSPMLPVVNNDRSGANNRSRGIFAVVIMDEHMVMDNCYVYGPMGVLDRCYMNKYLHATDNHFEFLYDCVVMTSGYALIEGNEVICKAEYYNIDVMNTKVREQSHGLFHRDRAYLADNTIRNVGQLTTDGEVICAEPISAYYGYGMVLGTGINTAYVNTAEVEGYVGRRYIDLGTEWGYLKDISFGVFGRLTLIITSGTGMGQVRYIDRNLLEGENSNRVYLAEDERDFDIVPDSTSTFSLETPMHNVVIYNNYAYDATKGLLLYGNFHDSIVAENYNENTEGICVWTAEAPSTQRFSHNYRITVRDNVVKGRSKCGYVGIGTSINFSMYTDTEQNTANYHIEIRNNYLYGDRKDGYDSKDKVVFRKYSTESEAPDLDGYYVYVFRNSTPNYLTVAPYKTHNVLLANNYVENTLGGVYVGDYLINGVLVDNTTYVDVKYKRAYEEFYIYKLNSVQYPPEKMLPTIQNVIYTNEHYYNTHEDYLAAMKAGEYVDYIAPMWEDSSINLYPLGSQTYIDWTEARDDIAIEGYDVYLDGVLYTHTSDNHLLVNQRVSHVEVYAYDTYGNVSNVPISTGDSIIINGKTSIGSIAKAINNSFSYTLQAGLNRDIDNVSFVLNYDPNILKYVSATLEVEGNHSVTAYTGKLVVNVNLTKAYRDLTDVITFDFEIMSGVSLEVGSKVSFNLSDVKVKDGNYEFETSLVASGERYLTVVSKETSLDFTKDGQINTSDYNYVLTYLGVKSTDDAWTIASGCDINGDGIIDISDLMTVYYNMKKYD